MVGGQSNLVRTFRIHRPVPPTAEAPAPYVDACLLFVAIRDTAETHNELMEKAKKTGAAFDSHPTRPPVYGFFFGGCDS